VKVSFSHEKDPKKMMKCRSDEELFYFVLQLALESKESIFHQISHARYENTL
jgi:hypothetical protein